MGDNVSRNSRNDDCIQINKRTAGTYKRASEDTTTKPNKKKKTTKKKRWKAKQNEIFPGFVWERPWPIHPPFSVFFVWPLHPLTSCFCLCFFFRLLPVRPSHPTKIPKPNIRSVCVFCNVPNVRQLSWWYIVHEYNTDDTDGRSRVCTLAIAETQQMRNLHAPNRRHTISSECLLHRLHAPHPLFAAKPHGLWETFFLLLAFFSVCFCFFGWYAVRCAITFYPPPPPSPPSPAAIAYGRRAEQRAYRQIQMRRRRMFNSFNALNVGPTYTL